MQSWHLIHDFLHGWGYTNEDKYIWCRDAERLLGKQSIKPTECEQIYQQIQPLLQQEAEELKQYLNRNPPVFRTLQIPNIRKPWPQFPWAVD
jgi:hypothetical protein